MADFTPERRAEIRERAEGATAGPWEAEARTLYVVAPGHVHIADFEWLADTDEEWKEFERNAAFVAHARQDVPDLLDEVERLTAGIRALHARCMQGARDNGEYYERAPEAKYELGKATVWDGVAEMLRELLPAVAETEALRG